MNKERVACVTHHKFPAQDRADEEFTAWPVRLQCGAVVSMELAERGTRLSNGLWVREIRKRTNGDHQTAVLATDYGSNPAQLAGAMFSCVVSAELLQVRTKTVRPGSLGRALHQGDS